MIVTGRLAAATLSGDIDVEGHRRSVTTKTCLVRDVVDPGNERDEGRLNVDDWEMKEGKLGRLT